MVKKEVLWMFKKLVELAKKAWQKVVEFLGIAKDKVVEVSDIIKEKAGDAWDNTTPERQETMKVIATIIVITGICVTVPGVGALVTFLGLTGIVMSLLVYLAILVISKIVAQESVQEPTQEVIVVN